MFQTLVKIDKENPKAVFLQLADQLREQILDGTLPPGSQLPGSRKLAACWQLHRKTVIAALDELLAQGWLLARPGKGTFISEKIESDRPQEVAYKETSPLIFPVPESPEHLKRQLNIPRQTYRLDDGLPDPRLAPANELARAYKTALTSGNLHSKYGYTDTKGHERLREVLCKHLQKSRNLNITTENILITRGVTQALYLSIQGFLKPGDKVAISELNWESGNVNLRHHGAELLPVRIDHHGMDTDHLEGLLKEHAIKMVYVTPHHQYPTTVIMPAHRRIKLNQLARQYSFLIFEDDYDYDFHYTSQPLMPLASAAHGNHVLYTGSFTKAISPAFRVGYLVASAEQIELLAYYRRVIDRQGDTLLEIALAELLELGILQRYLRKNKRIYETRRDYFCQLLHTELKEYIRFQVPEGGMSVWTQFDPGIDLVELSAQAARRDLYFYNGEAFGPQINSSRLGFASSTENELEISVNILKQLIQTARESSFNSSKSPQ